MKTLRIISMLITLLVWMWYGVALGYEPCEKFYPNDLQMQDYCVIMQSEYLKAVKTYSLIMGDEEKETINFCLTIHYNKGVDWELTWKCIEIER